MVLNPGVSVLYHEAVVGAEYPVFPHWAGFSLYGYAAAVEVELDSACGACSVPVYPVYAQAVAGLLAVGARPVESPHVAVACRWRAYDESAKTVVEWALLQLYLGDVYSGLVAQCVDEPVLSRVGTTAHADELSGAFGLVVRVYGGIEDEVGSVA